MNNFVFHVAKLVVVIFMMATCLSGCAAENKYTLKKEYTFIQEEGGQYSLSNLQGEEIYGIRYFENYTIASTKVGHILFDENEKSISPPYEKIVPIFDELLDQEAWKSDYYFTFVLNGKCGLMNKKGEVIIKNQFENIYGYNNGILSFVEDGNTGLISLQGDIIVPPQPGYFSSFRNGVAMHSDGHAGISAINQNGDVLIAPKYRALVILENGYVMAYTADIDQQVKETYDSEVKRYGEFYRGYSALYNAMFENIKWGLYDNQGNLIIPPTYSSNEEMLDLMTKKYEDTLHGLILYDTSEGEGVVNLQGAEVLAPYYDYLYLADGESIISACRTDPEEGAFIDLNMNQINKVPLLYADHFSDGMGSCKVAGKKFGYMDKTGEFVIEPQRYKSFAGSFYEGLAFNRTEEQSGYMNKKGEWKIIANGQFNLGGEFNNGRAIVVKDGKAGLIDKHGNFIIPIQYTEMKRLSDSLYSVFNGEDYGCVDKNGKELIPVLFDDIEVIGGRYWLELENWATSGNYRAVGDNRIRVTMFHKKGDFEAGKYVMKFTTEFD